ncbi:hypothetical protein AU476_27130 [Cupriavidus sp. UYMSc13B]|nr:hypothetical protein AU476_27130 [Cupriavidus sp. UYMSc13B]
MAADDIVVRATLVFWSLGLLLCSLFVFPSFTEFFRICTPELKWDAISLKQSVRNQGSAYAASVSEIAD